MLGSHCSYCGALHTDTEFPKTCGACKNTSFVNPVAVCVGLVTVYQQGVLLVRRAIQPFIGGLALPGGFQEVGETLEEAAAREVREESGVRVDITTARYLGSFSVSGGKTTLVFFSFFAPDHLDVNAFVPTKETQELVIVNDPVELCFPVHSGVLRAFFERRSR